MPSNRYTEKFKMDMDDYDVPDNTHDDAFREDMQSFKLEKLSTRVTLITILIPILIAVMLVVSYLDIKQKVVQTQTTGTLGVQNLSKDLESRFSSLSVRQAKLEDMMKQQLSIAEKQQAEYAVDQKKISDNYAKLSQKMADKKKLSDAIVQFNDSLTILQEEIASNHTVVVELESSLNERINQLTSLNQETKKRLENLSQTTSKLTEEKLDRKKLDFALKLRDLKLQEGYQEQTRALKDEIELLSEKTDQLSKELNNAVDQIKAIEKTAKEQKKSQTAAPPKATPATPPQKGKIVEQDLN